MHFVKRLAQHFASTPTLPDDPAFNKSQDDNVRHTIQSLALPSQPVSLPFTQQQLTDACHDINTHTAQGPDDMSPHFLKHGGPMLISCLFLLFHLCYQHGVLPQQWTDGIVVALYKHSGDKHDVNNYRPINLTSVCIRLFERLMLPTLHRYMSLHNIPCVMQFGFTKLRSTYDAIFSLLKFIGQYFKVPIPCVFIDIKKAYDRVWVAGLIHKLHTQLHMNAHDLFFYRALLSNRRFRVSGNGFMSHSFSTPDGVPQGSVSAPQLFIIYIHDLIDVIHSAYIRINLFADDIVIWPATVLAYPSTVMNNMQDTLNKLSTWASTWKITFSSTKTQMIIFYAYTMLPPIWSHFQLTLSGFNITMVDTYVYLGLTLHKCLDWTPHITEMIRRATITSRQITRLAFYTINGRPPLPVIRQLINAVLIPKLTYGLPFIQLYSNASHPLMLQLKRLLIIPLRRSLGLPHNAHHESIFVESRVLPIPYIHLYHSLLFARRYIKQATSDNEAESRFHDLFRPLHVDMLALYPSSIHYQIAMRCRSITSPYTTSRMAFTHAPHHANYGTLCSTCSIIDGTNHNIHPHVDPLMTHIHSSLVTTTYLPYLTPLSPHILYCYLLPMPPSFLVSVSIVLVLINPSINVAAQQQTCAQHVPPPLKQWNMLSCLVPDMILLASLVFVPCLR